MIVELKGLVLTAEGQSEEGMKVNLDLEVVYKEYNKAKMRHTLNHYSNSLKMRHMCMYENQKYHWIQQKSKYPKV